MFFGALVAGRAQAQTVEFGATSYTANEDGAAATVTVLLSTAPAAQVTIPLTKTNADGTEDADYSGVPANLVFGTTDTDMSFTVTAASDTADEPDKSVELGFGMLPAGVTAGIRSTATVTLADDDSEPELSIAGASATEGSSIRFTVTLSAASERTVTVRYATSTAGGDTAVAGEDFNTVTAVVNGITVNYRTLTFDAGETSQTATVSTVHDTVDEENETFTVTLSNEMNARITGATGTGTINDDDAAPNLSIGNGSATEGDPVRFTVTLSPASEKTVTVGYAASVAGGTAESSDLTGTQRGALTFTAGTTTQTVTVDTSEDTTDEENETFTVTLSSASNARITGATGTGTINDDDAAPNLSIGNGSATEGDPVRFTVTLSKQSEKRVTVGYAASAGGGTAESGDLTGTLTGTLTFAAGTTTQTVTVDTREDTTDEDNETFTVTLSNEMNARITGATGTGTINDDDAAPNLEIADAGATEGNPARFAVTLSARSEKTVTVDYAASAADGTAETGDLRGTLTGTLTFAAGTTTQTVTVETREDTTDEDNETFTVTLSSASNATVTDGTGTGTINDDDAAPNLEIADAGADEGDPARFAVTLSARSEKTVTVRYAASAGGGTAEAGDLTGTLTGTLTFAAGTTARTVTVETSEDTTDEENETFTVTLSSASNARITGATGTGTINDDDDPPTVRIGDSSAEEGNAVSFTATLSQGSEKRLTVAYTASVETGDTAKSSDLTGTLTGNLTFNAGDTSKTFTVRTRGDNIDERDETFTATLSNAPNPSNVTIADGTAVGTIGDDDETPTVTLSLSHTLVAEDSGTAVAVTARLNHPSTETTTVTVSADGPPTSHIAFNVSTNRTLIIAAEQTASTGDVTVTPVDDETDSPDNVVAVRGTAQNALAVEGPSGILSLRITDDDPAPVPALVLSPALILESGNPNRTTVTATLDRPSSDGTTFTVTAEALGAAVAEDFTLAGSTLTIAALGTESTGTVTLTAVDNNVDAPDKEVEVSAVAVNGMGSGGLGRQPADVTLTIEDEDPPPKATLVVGETTIRESDDPNEGGDQHVTTMRATLSGPSSEPTTITITQSPGDFTLSSSGRLTIAAGATGSTASVTLTAVDDNTDAPDKMRTLTATAVNTQGVMQPDGVELTITDEEPPPAVTLVLSREAIDENGGAATVRATLSHPSSHDTSVTVEAAPVSPARASDFALTGSVLSIPAGMTASTTRATVTPVDNNVDAPDKEVTVSATATNGKDDGEPSLAGDPDSLTLTIRDNERAPTLTLTLSSTTLPEDGGEAVVTASLSHPSSEPTAMTVTAAAVSPAESADFSLVGSSMNVPAGLTESTGTVTLETVDNDVDEADKRVNVSLEGRNNQGLRQGSSDVTTPVTVGPRAVTIEDDDERGFEWFPRRMTTTELSVDNSFTVVLTSQPTDEVTVPLTASAGRLAEGEDSEDWSDVTLTFTPGNWDVPQWVNYGPTNGGTYTITHAATGGDYAGLVGNYTVTVFDLGGTSNTVSLTTDHEEIAESDGATVVEVTSRLNGGDNAEAIPVVVTVSPGTASTDDYTASPETLTMTIGVGQRWVRGTITLVPANDGVEEGNEKFTLTGTTTASGYTVRPAELTIVDDDARGITVSAARLSVDEDGSRDYTVVLDSEPTADVMVALAVTGSSDVAVSPEALTFTSANWSTPQAVTVTAADDDDPAGEQATVSHAVSGGDYGDNNVTAAPVLVTVVDDDGRGVTVSARDVEVREGESTTYTVELNSEPTGNVLVRLSVSGDADIMIQPASLTFTAANWEMAQTVTVSARNDADGVDDRASVSHAVSGADYGANNVPAQEVLVTARDAGVTLAMARLVATDSGLTRLPESEGRIGIDVRVELLGEARPTPTPVAVLVRGGTASAVDFSVNPAAFHLIVPPGRTSATTRLRMEIADDDVDEEDETVVLTGTGPGLEITPLVITIVDDDERGLRVSREGLTVDEDESAHYGVALSSQPTGSVTVTPAVDGASEVTVRPETLTFTAADWNRQQTVRVFAARDPDGDNDDRANVTHSASGADYDGVTGSAVAVTVRDDGVKFEGVRLEVDTEEVAEDSATRTVTVAAILAIPPHPEATVVTVRVESGTATEGTDFQDVADFTITIPPNGTRVEGTFELTPTEDVTAEANETVIVGGTAADLLVRPTEIVITDNDLAPREVTLTVDPVTVAEDAAPSARVVTVTAAFDVSALAGDTEVSLSLSGLTATQDTDFQAVSDFTLTIPEGVTSGRQTFTLTPVDDEVDEPDETVRLRGRMRYYPVTPSAGVEITIGDNEDTPEATLVLTPDSVREDGGASRVTALLNRASSRPTTIAISTAPGSDTQGADFNQSGAALTIPAGATGSTGTVTVRAVDNQEVQTAPRSVTVSGAATNDLGVTGPADVTLAIADDESPSTRAILSVTPELVAEGRTTRVTATAMLDAAPREDDTVYDMRVSGGTATEVDDYAAVAGFTLTIAAGSTSGAASFELAAVDDETDEPDETVRVHAVASVFPLEETLVTITDELRQPPRPPVTTPPTPQSGVTLALSPEQMPEGAAEDARTVTVEATLTGGAQTEDTEVTVTVSGGTATEGADFAAVADFVVTIGVGQSSGAGSFTLAPVDDAVDEPDETVVVTGSASGVAAAPAAGVAVTITDDDERGVAVTPTALEVSKGGSGSYEVSLASQPTGAVTIEVSTNNPAVTADPALLRFEPEQWNVAQMVTVAVADDDSVEEAAVVELTYTVTGGDYGENGVTVGPVTARVTAPGVALALSPERLAEDAAAGTVTVTATLEAGPRTEDTEVAVTVTGGTATEGADFAAVAGFTITISAGETSRAGSFTLLPVDDAAVEADETVVATGAAAGLGSGVAEVTITDNDERGVRATPAELAVLKGGEASYRVALTSQPTAAVTIEVSSDNPAVTADPALLTFEPDGWNAAQAVTVRAADGDAVADNTVVELAHTVSGGDYGENGVTLGPVAVTVTRLRAALSVSPEQVAEGATGSARTVAVTVTLEDAAPAVDTAVTVTVSGGTATEGADFAAVPDFTLTVPEGRTSGSGSFTLAPVDDAVDEPDETVVVAGAAAGLAAPAVRVTITDDDERGVTVTPTELTVPEGGSAAYEVALASQPTSEVTVTVKSDSTEVTVNPSFLTYTASSWDMAQTVTVGARDDELVEDDARGQITHAASGGDYGSVTVEPVTVTVPGHEVDGTATTFKVPATGEVTVPDGASVPRGTRVTLPAALAGETLVLTGVATAPALADPPRGFNAGDPVVDIELGGGMALGAGQTATVCLPVPGGGNARVYRYDEFADPPEWVQLTEPSGGSPEGLACGVTDRFSLFTLGSAPNEAVAKGWLGRFGRLAAQHVVDALRDRMAAERKAGVDGTVAGKGIVTDGEAPESVAGLHWHGSELAALRRRIDAGSVWPEDEFRLKPDTLTVRDLLTGTRFSLTGATVTGGSVGLWGRGALSRFTGREGDATVEGDVTTATLGADWASGSVMAGLAVSHSRGEGVWRRDGSEDEDAVESSLTGVHPYFAYEVTDRLSVWGVVGHGRGDMTVPDGSRTIEAGIDMTMTAAGARTYLTSAGSGGGPELALKVDGLYLRIGSDAVRGLEAVEADVSRVRLGLESSWAMRTENGPTLTPSLEIAVRHDWGDVETGIGVDVGGGLTYSDPGRGVTASVNARGLVAHKVEDLEDWGVSGALGLDLDPSSERGFSVSLRQSAGSSASDGVDAMFRRESLAELVTAGNADTGGRLEAETAYGFGILGDRFTGTPYFKFGLSRTGRDYTIGWRLTPLPSRDLDVELRASATRRENGGEGGPEHGVALEVKLRW